MQSAEDTEDEDTRQGALLIRCSCCSRADSAELLLGHSVNMADVIMQYIMVRERLCRYLTIDHRENCAQA